MQVHKIHGILISAVFSCELLTTEHGQREQCLLWNKSPTFSVIIVVSITVVCANSGRRKRTTG